jgi:hypothetical protein
MEIINTIGTKFFGFTPKVEVKQPVQEKNQHWNMKASLQHRRKYSKTK